MIELIFERWPNGSSSALRASPQFTQQRQLWLSPPAGVDFKSRRSNRDNSVGLQKMRVSFSKDQRI
ncbi:hypothetical protein CCR75_000380 [Bremia lactucae]|uniref:Uncharacterized protein n=1 Tax=Bremia lactucae TaxID=4779 RepID=A0A976IFI1_BRELC|nr:hypothetical protein CCR75_006766 [Bremia lactucae]TDH70453.1 hypothetical protein CCR75_000380 [Bremia lactucae]